MLALHIRSRATFGLVFVVFGALVISRSALAQLDNNQSLTIGRAVEIALGANPLTRVTDAGEDLAAAELSEAKSDRWLKLVGSTNFTRSNNPVFVFGSLLEQGRFGSTNFAINSLNHPDALNNFRSSLTVRLPISDQRQAETRISGARIKQQQADEQSTLVRQQIRFEVIKSYYGLLLNKEKLNVASEAVKTAEADVKRARDMFDAGVVVRSDLLAAQVQLSEFRQNQIQAAGELATALAAFNTALGVAVETPQQLAGELVNKTFRVGSTEQLIFTALENRSDFRRAVLSVRKSSVELKGARGEWLPRVEAFATTGASSSNFTSGSGDYAVGASVSFDIFDLGRKARIDKAKASESMAKAEQEHLASQIRFEVIRAYQQYISARERMNVVAETSAQASETLRIVQDRYHAGVTTVTELLRAQTALVRSRSDELTARYDLYVGYASLLLVTGGLNDVDMFTS